MIRVLVISTVMLVLATGLMAQHRNFNIYSLSTDNGLPSNDLTSVYQDAFGFLWIGSYEGAFRWDGYQFKKFSHDEDDTTSIRNNIVYAIYEDSKKRLWIATIDGLDLYDRTTDSFIHCVIQHKGEKIPVNAIAEDSEGKLWLGTSSGLCLYDFDNKKSEWFVDDNFDTIFCLSIDSDDNIWTGTFNGGVKKFSQRTKSFKRFLSSGSLSIRNIRSILADKNNNIWVGTFDQGLILLDREGNTVRKFASFSREKIRNQYTISYLYQDKNRRVWIGVGKEPLYYMDEHDVSPRPFDKTPLNNNTHSFTAVSGIAEDSFGNIWFATASSGLFYSNVNKNVFENYLNLADEVKGLKSTVITCFHEDKKGRIWIGTESSGFLKTDKEHRQFQLFSTSTHALTNDAVTDIKSDADGSLWITTWSGGVLNFDPETQRVKTFLHDPQNENSVPLNDAKSILPEDTIVWIGTHGEGLAAYDKLRNRFIHYRNNDVFPFQMNRPGWINHLFKDSRRRLWISTYSGLFMFDGKTFVQFSNSTDSTTISSNSVNMVAEDPSGRIWIATEGGLDEFDQSFNRIKRYRKHVNLPDIIKGIIVDHNNMLWLSSNEGLVSFDPRSAEIQKFDISDGIQSNSFFLKAVLKSNSGKLYFGGPRGFNVFHPDSISRVKLPDYFYVAELYIYNVRQTVRTPHSPLTKVLAATDHLTLEPDQNFFSVDVAAVNLYSPGKIEYAYLLEGLHNNWINLGHERKISFSGLDPGSYNLKVKYRNINGEWSKPHAALSVTILPPWYRTMWFKLVIVLALAGMLAAVFYLRMASIRERNKTLKAEVERRTHELSEANTFLLERNEEIKLQKERLEEYNQEILRQSDKILEQQRHITTQNQKLESTIDELQKLNNTKDHFFSILAHDLKNPISALTGISEFMKTNFMKLDKKEAVQYLNSIHKSSNAIYDLLLNLLNWSRTQSKNIEYTPTDFNVDELLQKTLVLLESQMTNKHIALVTDIDKDVTAYADYNMIDTALRNLISNAIKFTEYNGRISIQVRLVGESVRVSIADNGVGMDKNQMAHLFQLDKNKISVGTAGEKGTGLGLIITRDFIAANHGDIAIESAPGMGTTFTVTLPKSKSVVKPAMHVIPSAAKEVQPDFWESFPIDKLIKLKGQKILIVDDNAELRTYLKLILSGTFEIFEASNGQQGLDMAIDIQPSVIVSDLVMPVMNGLDFCSHIKNNVSTSHIPVILLTSQWEEQSQLKGYEAGADIYLTKPVKKELFIRVVLNIIQGQEKLRSKIQASVLSAAPFEIENGNINKVDEEFIVRVVSFVEANVSDQSLDAKMLCEEFGLSRTVLYSKVKSLTGQSVHEFIKSIRLKRSLLLLLEGRLNISQIALDVGFNSHSYFDKCFAKQFGMGPKEYVAKRKPPKQAG
jgi:ligand-binding sensor domain-containing protein/CheY-like chemotaxis protein/AraC-like DNA-binding protein